MRTPVILLTLALLLLVGGATLPPARAANGDLDRGFGGFGIGGRTLSDPFPGTTIADSIATPDEHLIVVGSDDRDIVVARYDAAGALDPTFGAGGVTRLDFSGGTDVARSVAMYGAQKILVAGTTTPAGPGASNADFAVARLNADGAPDLTFGLGGRATVDFNGRADRATSVAEFVAGEVLVAGSVEQNAPGVPCAPTCPTDVGLTVLDSGGGLVLSFGTNGRSQHDFGGDETPLAVLWSSNTIFVGGYRLTGATSEYLISLHQYGSGRLLPSFNGTGYRVGASPPSATDLVAIGSFGDEDVIATGAAGGDFGLLRFRQDGSPAWGNNGLMSVDFGGEDVPHTLLSLPDGSLAVAGASGARLALAHLTDRGDVIPNGAVTADLGDSGAAVRALGIALVADSRLWTSAALQAGGAPRLAQARHFLAGSADAGGQQATNLGGTQGFGRHNDDRARAAAFQPDGKLLVAGSTTPEGGSLKTVLVRYTTVGMLDPTFGQDGSLVLESIPAGATGMALRHGKTIVSGRAFDVARLTADGDPDLSFNGSGKASFAIPGGTSTHMAVQPDGKIVLVGQTNALDNFVIARLTSSGRPDPSFGLSGIQRIGNGLQAIASAIAVQPDGKLVVVGSSVVSTTDIDFVLVRMNADGTLDPSFDGDGKLTTGFGGFDGATSIVIQPDGMILVGGTSSSGGAAFARYRPEDGSLDRSFGSGGKVLLQITGSDTVRDLIVSEAGITAALCDRPEEQGVVVRLRPDGKLDTRANGNGRLPFRFGGQDCPLGLARTPGRIAAVGHTTGMLAHAVSHQLPQDIAVAVYEDVAAQPPPPPITPPALPTPRSSSFMPVVLR